MRVAAARFSSSAITLGLWLHRSNQADFASLTRVIHFFPVHERKNMMTINGMSCILSSVASIIIANSPQQYQRCLDIRIEVFVDEQNVPVESEIDQYEQESIHFLAIKDNQDAATGRIRVKDKFVKFERIATRKSKRRQGIASTMLQKMQHIALEKFPNKVPIMHAQVTAQGFYNKFGWKPLGEVFEEDGIDHIVMVLPPKNLSQPLHNFLNGILVALQDN